MEKRNEEGMNKQMKKRKKNEGRKKGKKMDGWNE